jgi:hypothetical protein
MIRDANMQEHSKKQTEEELKKWVKNQLDSAVRELMDQGLFNSVMIEAKPAWVLPFGLLIGMIREQDQRKDFDWFISGDCPTDRVHSTIASTAREAARHFSLQWQLEAKRLEDSSPGEPETDSFTGQTTQQLVEKAQSLYELVEEDSLWEDS